MSLHCMHDWHCGERTLGTHVAVARCEWLHASRAVAAIRNRAARESHMRIWALLSALAVLAGAGCSKSAEPNSESSAGSEKVEKATSDTGDKVDEAAEDVGDKVEEASE
jgi:hypothetical protein